MKKSEKIIKEAAIFGEGFDKIADAMTLPVASANRDKVIELLGDKETIEYKHYQDGIQKVRECGELQYSLDVCLLVLQVEDESRLIKDYYDEDSFFYKQYQIGLYQAKHEVNIAISNLAKMGDLPSIHEFEKRIRENQRLKEESCEHYKLEE